MRLEEPEWSLVCGGMSSNVVVVKDSVVSGDLRLGSGYEGFT